MKQKIKHCRECRAKTIHIKNSPEVGALGVIVNLVLVIATSGLWIIALLLYLAFSGGKWECRKHEVRG